MTRKSSRHGDDLAGEKLWHTDTTITHWYKLSQLPNVYWQTKYGVEVKYSYSHVAWHLFALSKLQIHLCLCICSWWWWWWWWWCLILRLHCACGPWGYFNKGQGCLFQQKPSIWFLFWQVGLNAERVLKLPLCSTCHCGKLSVFSNMGLNWRSYCVHTLLPFWGGISKHGKSNKFLLRGGFWFLTKGIMRQRKWQGEWNNHVPLSVWG